MIDTGVQPMIDLLAIIFNTFASPNAKIDTRNSRQKSRESEVSIPVRIYPHLRTPELPLCPTKASASFCTRFLLHSFFGRHQDGGRSAERSS